MGIRISERNWYFMSGIAQQTLIILDKLDEAAQISVLRFAEFLAAENDDDVAFYDEAKDGDDGYRISAEDLRARAR
jgi:hypothetical protein